MNDSRGNAPLAFRLPKRQRPLRAGLSPLLRREQVPRRPGGQTHPPSHANDDERTETLEEALQANPELCKTDLVAKNEFGMGAVVLSG
jgi:hypothetical protein